jgi:transposase-like protein
MSKTKSCADSDGGGPPSRPPPPRIPPAVSGIQYNFCKNPVCVNYGIEPKLKLKKNDHDFYTLSGGGKSLTLLKCKSCGERPPLKSNVGIVEELARIASYLEPMPKPSCPSPLCENHGIPLGAGRAYQSFGKNRGGSKRYRCGKCHATFSIPTPVRYQHDTHHNQEVFKMLVNKVPFARIVSMLGISWEVFYHRLDFIHRQCLAFAADRERNLKNLPIRRIYLATDRQDYTVNWTERKDKRNIVLSAVASADNSSGYVFGVHSNFDPSSDRDAVEADARSTGDCLLPSPLRKYARFWLECDYLASVNRTQGKRDRIGTTLDSAISATYATAGERLDV